MNEEKWLKIFKDVFDEEGIKDIAKIITLVNNIEFQEELKENALKRYSEYEGFDPMDTITEADEEIERDTEELVRMTTIGLGGWIRFINEKFIVKRRITRKYRKAQEQEQEQESLK